MVDFLRVEAADRFIHQEQFRPRGEGARKHQELAVQHRKLTGCHIVFASQTYRFKCRRGSSFDIRANSQTGIAAVVAPEIGSNPDVVPHGQGLEAGVQLKGTSDPRRGTPLRAQDA